MGVARLESAVGSVFVGWLEQGERIFGDFVVLSLGLQCRFVFVITSLRLPILLRVSAHPSGSKWKWPGDQ